jgi:hypothetical protein
MDRIAELEAENSRLTSEVNNWRDTAADAEGAMNPLRGMLYLVPRINKCSSMLVSLPRFGNFDQ